jgi:hypothetical protein
MSHTIDHVARTASGKDEVFGHGILAGRVLVTRKNPHVTNAGSRPNTQVSCWCCMLMVISTILNFVT